MEFYAIGLMSGTSLDGLDICFVRFEKEKNWAFEIVHAETLPYSQHWETKLRKAVYLKAEELLALDSQYGFYLAARVQVFISRHSIEQIDVVASHGHTVFHQPENKFTCQIGDGRAIKILTQIPVVYDFRSQDVLMGGNGAPLVPIGDELLFSEYDACLNIGGFSNISFKENGKRIAFDICPVNIVLNQFAKKLGKNFDENGDLAHAGTVDDQLLAALNSLDFYRQNPPKSLGTERLSENILPKLSMENPATILATFTEHAAQQIAEIINRHRIGKILCTGGGTHNGFLVESIRQKTRAEIIIPGKQLIDYKEALVFALMGILRLIGEINILSSATGSSADHCSGILV